MTHPECNNSVYTIQQQQPLGRLLLEKRNGTSQLIEYTAMVKSGFSCQIYDSHMLCRLMTPTITQTIQISNELTDFVLDNI